MWSQATTWGHMRSQEVTWNHKCLMRTQAIMVFIQTHMWHMKSQEAPHSCSEWPHSHKWPHCWLRDWKPSVSLFGIERRKPSCTFF